MASGTPAQFDASHHAVINLLGLGTIIVLPLARVPLLKLHWQGATTVFPNCACHLAQMSLDLYSKGGCARITTLGLLERAGSKMVLKRDCAVQKSEAAKL